MSGERINDPGAFFRVATLVERDVPVPGGPLVRVRELSVELRSEFSRQSRENPGTVASWLLSVSCLRDNGMLLFSPEDIQQLQASSPRIVEYLSLEIMRLSGLLPAAGGGEGND